MRHKYWIAGLRSVLISVITYNCYLCKKLRANPVNPLMSDLPLGRLAYGLPPCSHCGIEIDYFGPLLVKIGRRVEKRWGVIFRCLMTRAIHLELAHTLSTDTAIMALQRMAARRRFPSVIYGDNGTNFRRASKELKQIILILENYMIFVFQIVSNENLILPVLLTWEEFGSI